MKRTLQFFRHVRFQRVWSWLHKLSLIGMNYWSSEFDETGERDALGFVAQRLTAVPYPIVFDVGANVGNFTLACLDILGANCTIHAFEPSAETHRLLTDRLASRAHQVTAHRIGFSSRVGEAVLHSSEPGSSIASLEPLERPVRPFVSTLDELVPVTTIDEFCLSERINCIDFLKLDIEGHEREALQGAKQMLANNRISIVQFEFGENNISSRTYLADFQKILDGFDLYRIVPGGLVRWSGRKGHAEIFATMNYLAFRQQGYGACAEYRESSGPATMRRR